MPLQRLLNVFKNSANVLGGDLENAVRSCPPVATDCNLISKTVVASTLRS
jgi:hypothetical protein